MSKFPEKLFCNLIDPHADSGDVYTYLTLETAAEGTAPIRVGVYQLVEVLETRMTVETVKVEN